MGDIAIACEGVWKSYRVYYERSHTLKERVLSRRHMYNDFWALRGIDLEVRSGTTVGIIGPNGSGKSTLLKTLARILTPNRGTVRVAGVISPLLELGTGFHPELTGRENVFLASSILGQTKRDIELRYDEISAFAGIEKFMDIPVKNYSSGMYARLAFAVAISVEPDILIVDEVLSVGDEGFQLRCYQRIAELREQGHTIVLVSHSLPTVRALCSQAVWLDGGEVKESGKAADVVAGYLAEIHGDGPEQDRLEKTGRRYGSGQAEIVEVAFLAEGGEHATSFLTGDTITIRVRYRALDVNDDLACAIAVLRGDSLAYVFGQNTVQAGVPLPASGEATVELTLPQLPLLQGRYVVNCVLHDHSGRLVYDAHDRKHWFSVGQSPSLPIEGGLVHVDSTWRAWTSTVPV